MGVHVFSSSLMRARDAVSREQPATRLVPCVLPGGPSAAPGARHLHVLLSIVIDLHFTIAMLPCGQIVICSYNPRAPHPPREMTDMWPFPTPRIVWRRMGTGTAPSPTPDEGSIEAAV